MRTAAKKRFGQHFLRDTGVLDRICRLFRPEPEDVVIEIGAGDGVLSARLAPSVATLLAVELDADCLPALEHALSAFRSARVVPGDILKLNLENLVQEYLRSGSRLRIVGNLPYNIATAIIRRILLSRLPVSDMLFMIQLEVAERITASPGSKQFGFMSVLCQHFCEGRTAFKVSPSSFVPRPKVTSAVLTLRSVPQSRDPEFEACLVSVLKAAFTHRRKTLANSLRRSTAVGGDPTPLLHRAGIDGSRRPEDLAVEDYERLAMARLRSDGVRHAGSWGGNS